MHFSSIFCTILVHDIVARRGERSSKAPIRHINAKKNQLSVSEANNAEACKARKVDLFSNILDGISYNLFSLSTS